MNTPISYRKGEEKQSASKCAASLIEIALAKAGYLGRCRIITVRKVNIAHIILARAKFTTDIRLLRKVEGVIAEDIETQTGFHIERMFWTYASSSRCKGDNNKAESGEGVAFQDSRSEPYGDSDSHLEDSMWALIFGPNHGVCVETVSDEELFVIEQEIKTDLKRNAAAGEVTPIQKL
jgi:hypothetical protein